ncbi:hypothetical protein BH09PLA1_BH09PLA1_33020 [soil metagenome]
MDTSSSESKQSRQKPVGPTVAPKLNGQRAAGGAPASTPTARAERSSSAVAANSSGTSSEASDRRETPRGQGPDRRATVVDRRSGLERRQQTAEASGYEGEERRSGRERRDSTGLERRRGPGRRRSDDRKAAEEGEMTAEQFEFVMAIQTYKKVNKKMYPTWTEVLEVVRQLGYRKVEHRNINLSNVPEPELTKTKVA